MHIQHLQVLDLMKAMFGLGDCTVKSIYIYVCVCLLSTDPAPGSMDLYKPKKIHIYIYVYMFPPLYPPFISDVQA